MIEIAVSISMVAFDPDAVFARFRERFADAGGVVSFVGQVRPEAGRVTRLALEHYPRYTARQIEKFCADAAHRWNLDGLCVVHRVGEMEPGEPIVMVCAAATHRRNAFEVVDFLMDYLKSEAPFWKREFDGSAWRWIQPRAEDYADMARWRKDV